MKNLLLGLLFLSSLFNAYASDIKGGKLWHFFPGKFKDMCLKSYFSLDNQNNPNLCFGWYKIPYCPCYCPVPYALGALRINQKEYEVFSNQFLVNKGTLINQNYISFLFTGAAISVISNSDSVSFWQAGERAAQLVQKTPSIGLLLLDMKEYRKIYSPMNS